MLRRGIFEIVRGADDLARLLERVLDFACGEQRSRCCVLGESDRDPGEEREHSYQVIVFMVGVNQAELVVVHHGGVERTNRARESAGCRITVHEAHTDEALGARCRAMPRPAVGGLPRAAGSLPSPQCSPGWSARRCMALRPG